MFAYYVHVMCVVHELHTKCAVCTYMYIHVFREPFRPRSCMRLFEGLTVLSCMFGRELDVFHGWYLVLYLECDQYHSLCEM